MLLVVAVRAFDVMHLILDLYFGFIYVILIFTSGAAKLGIGTVTSE